MTELPAAWGPAIEAGMKHLNCPLEYFHGALRAVLNQLEKDGMAKTGAGYKVKTVDNLFYFYPGKRVDEEFPALFIRTGGPNEGK